MTWFSSNWVLIGLVSPSRHVNFLVTCQLCLINNFKIKRWVKIKDLIYTKSKIQIHDKTQLKLEILCTYLTQFFLCTRCGFIRQHLKFKDKIDKYQTKLVS